MTTALSLACLLLLLPLALSQTYAEIDYLYLGILEGIQTVSACGAPVGLPTHRSQGATTSQPPGDALSTESTPQLSASTTSKQGSTRS